MDEFLRVYNSAQAGPHVAVSHPDQDNRDSKDIDALANADGYPRLAIEHTKIETLDYQNRDSAWFIKAFGSLEQDFKNALPFSVILVFPYQNVVPGQRWPEIREAIRQWLTSTILNLPVGRSDHSIPEVPFKLTVWRRPRGSSLFLSRGEPANDPQAGLMKQMDQQLGHKYERLREYHEKGAVSVLLLESEDNALVNWGSLYEAYLRATEANPRPQLDQVWLACTFVGDCEVCCFAGPQDLMDRANPENYMLGPGQRSHWTL